jgi:hypothetical protein
MKKLLLLLVAVSVFSCNRPDPENEGVLMTDYGRNGIESFETVTGAQGPLGPGSELYEVPMYEQAADPAEVTILSNNSGKFVIDPSYTYQGIRGKGPQIILKYKQHNPSSNAFLDNIEDISLNRIVVDTYREVARTYSTDSLMSNLQSYEDQVYAILQQGFLINNFELGILTSGLTPPADLIKSINKTNDAIQIGKQLDNELQNAKKEQLITQVKAETAKIESKGLTPEILQLKFIEAIGEGTIYITDGRTPLMLKN